MAERWMVGRSDGSSRRDGFGRRQVLAGAAGLAFAGLGARRVGAKQATPVAPSREGAPMDGDAGIKLWDRWGALWNGDLGIADEIVAPDFVAHFAPVGPSPAEVRGPDGLKGWLGGAVAAFEDHRFATQVGPLVDGDLVAGRWVFTATYRGGFPGASPEAVGRRVEYAGADFLRVEGGRIAEYWLTADILVLLQQLGAMP